VEAASSYTVVGYIEEEDDGTSLIVENSPNFHDAFQIVKVTSFKSCTNSHLKLYL
jgi:hypothetical protein